MKTQDFHVLNLVFDLGEQKVSEKFVFRFGKILQRIPYSLSVGFDRAIAEKKFHDQQTKPQIQDSKQ